MNREELAQLIQSLVQEYGELDGPVDPKTHFRDLNIDSLMSLEIIVSVEKKLGLKIPEANYPRMTDLESAVAVVEEALQERKSA
jgi:acyl carrier protein